MEKNNNDCEFEKKIDKIMINGTLIGIVFLFLIGIFPEWFYFLLLLVPFIVIFLIFVSINTINQDNNGKDGYYAEYGTSYGANAYKHEQYIEDKVANNIMNK